VLCEIGQNTRLRKIVTLELPAFHAPKRMEFALHHSAHLNQRSSRFVPFDSSEVRNIYFQMHAVGYHLGYDGPELVVFAATINHYRDKYLQRDDLGSTASIPWTDWVPHNTRLIFPSRRNDPFLGEIQGSRHVCIDNSKSLTVLDFTPNLAAVSPDSPQSQSSTRGSICEMESNNRPEPNTDNYESPFQTKDTSLPYHGVKRKVGPAIARAKKIFVDNEHIIVFTVSCYPL
jgi:hypothetical protein